MTKFLNLRRVILVLIFAAGTSFSQSKTIPLEIELLTHTEIYDAIHKQGKTTVLIYNGGTEQRGPHAVLGGHTFIARAKAERIAEKLGNALVAPVLPFTITTVDGKLPGSITLTAELFKQVNIAVIESMVKNGFKDIVLMGDHGGGQKELSEVADAMDRKYAAQGVRVYFCGDVYEKSHRDFDNYLKSKGLPLSTHGGIPDTSELLYLQPSTGLYVRDIYKTTVGDPVSGNARRLNNGIIGDPRPSTPDLGKLSIDITVNNGVTQIQHLIAEKRKNPKP